MKYTITNHFLAMPYRSERYKKLNLMNSNDCVRLIEYFFFSIVLIYFLFFFLTRVAMQKPKKKRNLFCF